MTRGGSRRERTWGGRAAVALTAIGALVAAGCQVGNDKADRTVDITTDAAGTAQFTPLETTVQKGDRVTIVVINRTSRVHGFAIRGYSVPPIEVGPDAPNNVVFTARNQGTFEIYCQLHETHKRAELLVE